MTEAAYNFSASDYTGILKELGGESNFAQQIVNMANEDKAEGVPPILYEELKDGTSEFLNLVPEFQNLSPEERRLNDSDIMGFFTNARQFDSFGEAFIAGAVEETPEAVGFGYGAKKGFQAGMRLQSAIPPVSPLHLLLKGGIVVTSTLGGSLVGGLTTGTVDDLVTGPEAPVTQQGEKFGYEAGKGTMLYASALPLVVGPTRITAKSIKDSSLGAMQFLSNFKNVAQGGFRQNVDEAFEIAAKRAGLSENQFRNALKAKQITAERGPMFGGTLGQNIGFTRFNPAGTLFDPSKGPISTRVLGGLEGGIKKSAEFASQYPKRFLAAESAAALGAGTLGGYSEYLYPGDVGKRFLSELAGTLVVPLPVQILADINYTGAIKSGIRKVKDYYTSSQGKKGGILDEKFKTETGQRIFDLLVRSEEFSPQTRMVDGQPVELTGLEQIDFLMKGLIELSTDEKGNPVSFVNTSDLATLLGLPFNKTLTEASGMIAAQNKRLQMATRSGREKATTAAQNALAFLSQTDDPNMMTLAGNIAQKLFEDKISTGISLKIEDLTEAFKKVSGRDIKDLEKGDEGFSKKLYEILKNQIQKSKDIEKGLWDQTGDVVLTRFFSDEGTELDVPNIVRLMESPELTTGPDGEMLKGMKTDLKTALGQYSDDIEDIVKFFRPEDPPEGVIGPVQTGPEAENPMISKKMFKLRSNLLEKSAQAYKKGDKDLGALISKMAATLLRDITGEATGTNMNYNVARAYTFARNNVFTRSFLGDLQEFDGRRALIISPDELIDKLFMGSSNAVNKRFNEIKVAEDFLIEGSEINGQIIPGTQLNPKVVNELGNSGHVLGELLKQKLNIISDIKVDPITNQEIATFNLNKYQTFLKQPGNRLILEKYPDIKRDIDAFKDGTKSYKDLTDPTKKTEEDRLVDMVFKAITNSSELPSHQIGQVLKSQYPQRALDLLYNKTVGQVDKATIDEASGMVINTPSLKDVFIGEIPTKRDGSPINREDLEEAFRRAIFGHANMVAKTGKTNFNPFAFQDTMFTSIGGVNSPLVDTPQTQFNLINWMKGKGLLGSTEPGTALKKNAPPELSAADEYIENLQTTIKQAKDIQEAFDTGNLESVLFKDPSLSKLFAVRILGATAGGAFQNKVKNLLGIQGGSGGLIAESTGSEVIQRLLIRGPETVVSEYLAEAFANPEVMVQLVKPILDKKNRDQAIKALETIFSVGARQVGRRAGAFPAFVERREELPTVLPQEEPEIDTTTPQLIGPDRFPLTVPKAIQSIPSFNLSQVTSPASIPTTQQAQPQMGSPDPNLRTKYASLFPDDPISGMLGTGGITNVRT
jgi:hypothetical protein